MKRLRDFDYHEPTSIGEAIEVLANLGDGAMLLAGGTDLVVDLKTRRATPTAVVNLKHIEGLSGIEALDGATRIGALTRVSDLQHSSLVHDRHPALIDAAAYLGPPPVRALATIGGNVGRASPASDLGPALIVTGGRAVIEGVEGVREELVEDLYTGPGITTLATSDIITSFLVPSPAERSGSAYLKLGKRGSGTDIAIAGAGAFLSLGEDGTITDCRIALSSLGPTPMRAPEAERALLGRPPTEEILMAAADAARTDARPIGDIRSSAEYRLAVTGVLTRRALQKAIASTGMEAAA